METAPNAAARQAGQSTRTGIDVALAYLVRLVLDEAWCEERAASRLVQFVDGDVQVLRRVRTRILRAANDRTTDLTDRAVRTLRVALK